MTISFYNIIKLKASDIFLQTVKTMKIVKNLKGVRIEIQFRIKIQYPMKNRGKYYKQIKKTKSNE